jgi:uncharacterized protein YcfL
MLLLQLRIGGKVRRTLDHSRLPVILYVVLHQPIGTAMLRKIAGRQPISGETNMRNAIMILATSALSAVGCEKHQQGKTEPSKLAPMTPNATEPEQVTRPAMGKKLFLDVHALGPGKVNAEAVAQAHQKDLAVQSKHGVDFKAYWVDEAHGNIYCLAEAPSAEATAAVHKEAHGLLASKIMEVSADNATWRPAPGSKLYLDVHHLGPGKVTADAVAAAHAKDLATQDKHNVKYLNYWFDADQGTVMCLVEAPSVDAALAVHREAHGLLPDSIGEVVEGR